MINLEVPVAIAVVTEAQCQGGCIVKDVREEPITAVTHGDSERVRHFGQQVHIVGKVHLDGHLQVHLHVLVKRQETPEHGRDSHKREVEEDRPRALRPFEAVSHLF